MSFLITVFIFSALVGLIILQNIKRSRQNWIGNLTPNCLMTKYPILFIEGKKSIFYFTSYWNTLPDFLSQHGYEVYVLSLPWRNQRSRIESLSAQLNELSKHGSQFHVFFDSSCLQEVEELFANSRFSCIKTAHYVGSNNIEALLSVRLRPLEQSIEQLQTNNSKDPMLFFLHKLWIGEKNISAGSLGYSESTYDLLLKYIVSIAEKDFSHSLKNNQGRQHDRLQSTSSRDSNSFGELLTPAPGTN